MHVSDHEGVVEHIYSDDRPGQSGRKQHKQELKHRRFFDAHDTSLIIDADVEKYQHPLQGQLPHLYNSVTAKIA